MAGNLSCRRLGDNCSRNVSVLRTRGLSLKSKAYIPQTLFVSVKLALLLGRAGVPAGSSSATSPAAIPENERSPSRAPGAAPASGHLQPSSGVHGKTDTTRGHFPS